MRPSRSFRWLMLTFILSFLALPAFALEEKKDSGITITADQLTYDRAIDSYLASGNVKIVRQGMVLTADSATLFDGAAKASAVGSVVLTRDGTVLKGDRLDVDLQQQTGEMTNGTLSTTKGNFRLTGSRILKTGEQDYRVENGSFTTCDADPPSWRFTASTLDVTMEEFSLGRDVVFRAGEIPLFYSPYFVVPVKRERQSGFLFPSIGSSSTKGFTLQVPYYLAISPSMDATLTPGWMSDRGPLLGGEFRYIRRSASEGTLLGAVMYDTEEKRFRGEAGFRHRETISPLTRFAANLSWLSDRDYYRDFSDQSGVFNQQTAESTAYLTTTGPKYALSADILLTQNLDGSNSTTLQRFPRFAINTFRAPLFDSPFSFTFDAAATHFHRDEGERGERVELSPLLSWQSGVGEAMNLTAWAGYRQRFYRSEGNSATDGGHGDGIPQAGVTAATSLARVYDYDGVTIRRIRHLMVPEVSYRWVDAHSQENLPFFDYDDRVVKQNMVSYSLANYLTVREEGGDSPPRYREILSLRIGQGYSFSGDRRDLLTLVDEGNPFTDISLESRFMPTKSSSLSLDGRYNPYDGKISTFVVSGDMSDRWGNGAGLGYRFARDEVDYMEARLTLTRFRPFALDYRSRYSLDRHGFLEHFYSLEYRKQCWSVALMYRHRPGNDELQVGFTLYGLGTPGTFNIL